MLTNHLLTDAFLRLFVSSLLFAVTSPLVTRLSLGVLPLYCATAIVVTSKLVSALERLGYVCALHRFVERRLDSRRS